MAGRGLGELPLDKGVVLGEPLSAPISLFDEVPMPVAAIRKPALERNSRWMREFIRRSGISIAPHGKTTMVPEIFRMQIADGAWAITLSTLQQIRVARHFGVNRIFMANVLADPSDIRAIYAELERDDDFDFYCLIDSVAALVALVDGFRTGPRSRHVNVLVELGYQDGRTGCRTFDEALDLARKAAAAGPAVRLVGVEGFEGLIHVGPDDRRDDVVREFIDTLTRLAVAVHSENLFARPDFILSAGGSGFIDLVVSGLSRIHETIPDCRILIRSGCYISFDSGLYKEFFARMARRGSPGFVDTDLPTAALEVWARVISRPEPGRIIVGAGKRDLGADMEMPKVVKWLRPGIHPVPEAFSGDCRVVELNDQHAHLQVDPKVELRFADIVAFGVSHPCTTFDKWRCIQLVDDDYRIVDTMKTYF